MRINALGNTATDFASDDYIALDGTTNGSRKMKNDSLLKVTAQNALAGNVAQAFDATRTNTNQYNAGESVIYEGVNYTFRKPHYGAWDADDVFLCDFSIKSFKDEILADFVNLNDPKLWKQGGINASTGEEITQSNRLTSKMLRFTGNTAVYFTPYSYYVAIYCYSDDGTYLGYVGTYLIENVLKKFPTAKQFKVSVMNLPDPAIPANIIGSTITFTGYIKAYNNIVDAIDENASKIAPIYSRTAETINLNDSDLWEQGGIGISTGEKTNENTRLRTNYIAFKQGTTFTTSPSSSWYIVAYDKNYSFVGGKSSSPNIDDVLALFPTAVFFKFVFLNLPSNVQPSYIGSTLSFVGTYYQNKLDNLFDRVDTLERTKGGLSGKIWYACGDSFTANSWEGTPPKVGGNGPYKDNIAVYPYYIGQRTGCIVKNIARGGATIAQPSDLSFTNVFTRVSTGLLYTTDFSDADYITLYFGINDSQKPIPIGTIDDADNSTFYGAWNVALDYLTTNYPFAHIGIIISNGCNTSAYPTATKEVAEKWGIPFLDLDGGVGCPTMLRCSSRNPASDAIKARRLEQQRVSALNIHPNEHAHEFESFFIENWIKSL